MAAIARTCVKRLYHACCNGISPDPVELQAATNAIAELFNQPIGNNPSKGLLGDAFCTPQECAELTAVLGWALRQSATDGPSLGPARLLRRRLVTVYHGLAACCNDSKKLQGLATQAATALVRMDTLSCYSALLHESALALAGALQQQPRTRSGVVAAGLSLLSEATLLLSAFSTLIAADAAAMTEVRTALLASPFLDHACQLVQQLAALPEARQQLAAQLARLGGALRTLHSHDPAAASIPMSPPPLQPCLSYVLSSHVVGLCCALDGEQQTYGLPAVLGSTEPPPDPNAAAAAAAAASWSPFAAAASAPLPLFTSEGRPFMGHCQQAEGAERQLQDAAAPQHNTPHGPTPVSAQLALAALAVWTFRGSSLPAISTFLQRWLKPGYREDTSCSAWASNTCGAVVAKAAGPLAGDADGTCGDTPCPCPDAEHGQAGAPAVQASGSGSSDGGGVTSTPASVQPVCQNSGADAGGTAVAAEPGSLDCREAADADGAGRSAPEDASAGCDGAGVGASCRAITPISAGQAAPTRWRCRGLSSQVALAATWAACLIASKSQENVREIEQQVGELRVDLERQAAELAELEQTYDAHRALAREGLSPTALAFAGRQLRQMKDASRLAIEESRSQMRKRMARIEEQERRIAVLRDADRESTVMPLASFAPPYNRRATHVLCMRLACAALAAWAGPDTGRVPELSASAAAADSGPRSDASVSARRCDAGGSSSAASSAGADAIATAGVVDANTAAAAVTTNAATAATASAAAGGQEGSAIASLPPGTRMDAPTSAQAQLPAPEGSHGKGLGCKEGIACPGGSDSAAVTAQHTDSRSASPPAWLSVPPSPPRPVAVLAAGEAPLMVHAALRCARAAVPPLVQQWSDQHDLREEAGSRREMPAPLASRLAEWWGLLLQAAETAACGAGAGGSADAAADSVGRELLRWLGCCLAGNDCDEEGGSGSRCEAKSGAAGDPGSEGEDPSVSERKEARSNLGITVRGPRPDVSAALAAGWLPAVTRMLRRATTQMRAAAAKGGGEDAPAVPALLLLPLAGTQPWAGWGAAWRDVLAYAPVQRDATDLVTAAAELLRAAAEAVTEAGGSRLVSCDTAGGGGAAAAGAAAWTGPRLQQRQLLAHVVEVGMRLLDAGPTEWLYMQAQAGTDACAAGAGADVSGETANAGPEVAGDAATESCTDRAGPDPQQRHLAESAGGEGVVAGSSDRGGASGSSDGEAATDQLPSVHESGVSEDGKQQPGPEAGAILAQLTYLTGHVASRLLPAFSQAVLRLAAGEGERWEVAAAESEAGSRGRACEARSDSGGDGSGGDSVNGYGSDGGSGGKACGDGSGNSMDTLLLAASSQAIGWMPWLVTAAMAAAAPVDGVDASAQAAGDGGGDGNGGGRGGGDGGGDGGDGGGRGDLVRITEAELKQIGSSTVQLVIKAADSPRWARLLLFEEVDVVALLALLMRTLQWAEGASRHCGDSGRSLTPALLSSARLAACRALACLAAAFPDELRRAFGATTAESRSGGAADPAARAPLSWPAVASLLGPAGPLPQPELLAVLRRVVLEGGEVGDGEEARAAMEAAQLGNCMDLLRAGVHDSPTCWS